MPTALLIVRSLLGVLFVAIGLAHFIAYPHFAAMFAHWDIPAPQLAVFVLGALQLVCGVLLAWGVVVRPACLMLATIMVGAMLTAGRTDGGLHLIVPPILFGVLVFFAWGRGRFGAWRPSHRPGTQ